MCRADIGYSPLQQKVHSEVATKLLRLFAILLELPDEDQLARDHVYDVRGEDHLRYMHYAARPPADNHRVADLYVPGHTDLGSLTLLFRQPVAALQVLAADGAWKWVKPQDATITVNTADALTALTGGYIKSSVHRVHAPPPDQAHVDRLGVIYFARYDFSLSSAPPPNHATLPSPHLSRTMPHWAICPVRAVAKRWFSSSYSYAPLPCY